MGKQGIAAYMVPVKRGEGAITSEALPPIVVPNGMRLVLVILQTVSQMIYLEVNETGSARITSPGLWTSALPDRLTWHEPGEAEDHTK